jgi:hypothetical protein
MTLPKPQMAALLFAAAIVLGAAIGPVPALVGVVVPGILGVLVLVAAVRALCQWPEDPAAYKRVLTWTAFAFALHIVIGLSIASSAKAVNFFGGDASQYHQGAIAIVDHWSRHMPAPSLSSGKEGFYYLLAGTYFVFGNHASAGIVINAIFSAALVPIMADLTRRLRGPDEARVIVPLIVLLPGFLIWTSQLLREAGILFFIALAAYSAVRLLERTEIRAIFALCASLAMLLTFRSNVAVGLTAGLLGGLILGRRQLVAALGTGVSTASILGVLIFSLGIGYSGYRYASNVDLRQANAARAELSTSAASGFSSSVDISSPRGAAGALPVAVPQFLLGPLPWQVGGGRQLAGLIDAVAIWYLVPSFGRGLRVFWRTGARRMFVLVLPAVILTAMLSLVIGNFGTVIRERLQILILLLPIVATGWVARPGARAPALPAAADTSVL